MDKIAMDENIHNTYFPYLKCTISEFIILSQKSKSTILSNRPSNFLFSMNERNALAWIGQATLSGGEKQKEVFLHHGYYNTAFSENFFSLYPEQLK